ncbi:Growth arrest-specific protein 7, partial [Ataeniobius toweri]|nr:Growth arrest-specific protein 7 [Ataeniobius toweri]
KTSSLSQLPVEDIREPLPPHWRCYMSPQGKKYYVNTANNETTWERPSSVPGTPKSSIRHKNSLPAVNGFHSGGSPLHHGDHSHNSLVRRSSTEPQSSGSTSPIKKQNKESTVTINCVTFPSPVCMAEQQLLKPDEWSYCDYFWLLLENKNIQKLYQVELTTLVGVEVVSEVTRHQVDYFLYR